MTHNPETEEEFFQQNLPPPVEEIDAHDPELKEVGIPWLRYALLCLLIFAIGFYASSRLAYAIHRPAAQIVNLADPGSLQAVVQNSQTGDLSEAGAYHLFLVMRQKQGNGRHVNLVYNTMVETFLTVDHKGNCFLMFSDLAFQGRSIKEILTDPSLTSDTYGMVKVSCSAKQP